MSNELPWRTQHFTLAHNLMLKELSMTSLGEGSWEPVLDFFQTSLHVPFLADFALYPFAALNHIREHKTMPNPVIPPRESSHTVIFRTQHKILS